jgi:hypothetical protein
VFKVNPPLRTAADVAALRAALAEAFRDDAERLRAFAGRDFPGWTV